MSDEAKKAEAKTIIIDNNPNKILQDGILDVGIARLIPDQAKDVEAPKKVVFKPVELTPELIKQMALAEMLDGAETIDVDRPKAIKRVWENDKEIEAPEIDIYGSDGVEVNEVNTGTIGINLDVGLDRYDRWNTKFTEMLVGLSNKYKLSRTFKKLMWKNKINGWFVFLHTHYRISTYKEEEIIKSVIQEIFLQINSWDDKSIEQIEEMRKHCSIEGIRKNLPGGMKLWGFNSVGITG